MRLLWSLQVPDNSKGLAVAVELMFIMVGAIVLDNCVKKVGLSAILPTPTDVLWVGNAERAGIHNSAPPRVPRT